MDIIIAVWLVLCLIVAIVAGDYGRSRLGYFLLAFFLSPIIAGIILLVAGRSIEVEARRAVAIRAATERLDEQRRLRAEMTANPASYAAMMAAPPAQRWQWNSSGGRILLTILVLAFIMAVGAVFTALPR